jgi:NitT/TauT family transport system ATP-binding protein
MVFQKPQLYPWLNVLDNVLFGPKALGREKEAQPIARELISEVGLEGFERHRPYELSGGMQHRVALARTLVNQPPLLLMDEPFAALDAQTREEMQALLLDVWQRHRCTVVFVTHDLEESLLLSDRVLIMGHRPGSIQDEVPVEFARPREDSLVLDPEFVDMRGRIRSIFRREVV